MKHLHPSTQHFTASTPRYTALYSMYTQLHSLYTQIHTGTQHFDASAPTGTHLLLTQPRWSGPLHQGVHCEHLSIKRACGMHKKVVVSVSRCTKRGFQTKSGTQECRIFLVQRGRNITVVKYRLQGKCVARALSSRGYVLTNVSTARRIQHLLPDKKHMNA